MIIMASGGGGSGTESSNLNASEIQSDSQLNENEISVSTISNQSRSQQGVDTSRGQQCQGQGQGQGQGQQVPMDYSRFFHSLALMNLSGQSQSHAQSRINHSNLYSHPLLPPMLHPEHANPRWGFLNVSNRSFWTKYCLLCTVCGSAATILASIFLVIAALFRYYTTSIYYFETVPTYIPAILLSICGVSTIAFSCKRNRNIILLRITACWSLVSAALASVITITTSLIHMNRLQTLRECVYNGKPSPPSCTCSAHTLSFDSFGNSFEPVHYVFENTPDCDVIHGTLYSCLRAVFAISVVAVLLSIFLCMLLYQLIGHERKKAYWSRVRRTNSDWSADFMACLPRPMARDRSSMMPLVMPSSMSMSMPLSPTSMSMSLSGGCSGNGPVLPFPHPGLFAWGPPPPYEDLSTSSQYQSQSQDHRSRQLATTTTTTVTVNLSPTSRQAGGRQRQPPTSFVALPPVLTSSSSPSTETSHINPNPNSNHSFGFERRTSDDYPVINVNAFSPTITSMDFTSSRLLQRSHPIPIISSSSNGNNSTIKSINMCDNDNGHGISAYDEESPLTDADALPLMVTPPDSFKDTETETETDCEMIRDELEGNSSEKHRYPGDLSRADDDGEGDRDKLLQIEMDDQVHGVPTKNISVVVASIHNTDKSSLSQEVDCGLGTTTSAVTSFKDKDSIESLSLSLLSESESSKSPVCDDHGDGDGDDVGVRGGNEVVLANSSVSASNCNSTSTSMSTSTRNRIVRSFRLEKITSLPNSPILMNVRKFCSFRLGDKDRNERRFRSVAKLNEDRDRLDSIIISSSMSNSNVHRNDSEIPYQQLMMEPKKKTLCALDSSQSR